MLTENSWLIVLQDNCKFVRPSALYFFLIRSTVNHVIRPSGRYDQISGASSPLDCGMECLRWSKSAIKIHPQMWYIRVNLADQISAVNVTRIPLLGNLHRRQSKMK